MYKKHKYLQVNFTQLLQSLPTSNNYIQTYTQ